MIMTVYCTHCGKEIEEKAELCVHCGRRVRSAFATWLENNELTQLRNVKDEKSPGLAAFLGFLLGWIFLGPAGYLYLGQWMWFWVTLIISVLAIPLTAGIAYIVFPFIFAFHQYQMARELNEMLRTSRDAEGTPAES